MNEGAGGALPTVNLPSTEQLTHGVFYTDVYHEANIPIDTLKSPQRGSGICGNIAILVGRQTWVQKLNYLHPSFSSLPPPPRFCTLRGPNFRFLTYAKASHKDILEDTRGQIYNK